MSFGETFYVTAIKKDNYQPAAKGCTLSLSEVIQLQKASEKAQIFKNGKSLSYELLKLFSGEIPFIIWDDKHDVYRSAYIAYDDTKGLIDRFSLETFRYFDEVECIVEPIFLLFCRNEN